jgi:drug/metabolite transporter (DMT)-like permease
MLGMFFPAYLFAIAETQIGSSVTGILNALTPFNALLLGVFAFGLQVNRNQLFGVIVGLMGSLLLVFTGEDTGTNSNYFYVFLVYIATLCYGTNVNIVKKYLPEFNSLTIAAGNALMTLGPALVILYFTGFFEVVHLPKVQHSMLFIMVLGIFGTGIANLLFYKLIQISSPVFATSVTYLIPIVAFLGIVRQRNALAAAIRGCVCDSFWGVSFGKEINYLGFLGRLSLFLSRSLSLSLSRWSLPFPFLFPFLFLEEPEPVFYLQKK